MNLKADIESLLFMTTRPLSFKKLAELTKSDEGAVAEVVGQLVNEYRESQKGIQVMVNAKEVQMATNPNQAGLIKEFLKDEQTGELTKPSLEALTIIAYRGPITKAELEQIRGVNCSLILRNLLIKGLVEIEDNKEKMTTYYKITFDFMRFLGIAEAKDLPDFERLNKDVNLEKILSEDYGQAKDQTQAQAKEE